MRPLLHPLPLPLPRLRGCERTRHAPPRHISSPADLLGLASQGHRTEVNSEVSMPYSSEAERAVILTLHHEGKTVAEIQQHPLVSLKKDAIRRWIARGVEEGLDPGLKTRPKSGRPRVTTGDMDADLVASVEAQPHVGVAKVVRDLFPGYPATLKTARRR